MASATPVEGFLDAEVLVDGVAVRRAVRRLPEQVAISAWCDTRGLPPGLHEITVTGRWEDGSRAVVSRLLVVGVGEAAEWWRVPETDSPDVGLAPIGDPELERSLARTALGGPPLVLLDDGAVPGLGALERIAATFAGDEVDIVIGDEASMIAEQRWVRWRKLAFEPEALPSIDRSVRCSRSGRAPRTSSATRSRPGPACTGWRSSSLDRGLRTVSLPHVLALTPEVRVPVDDGAAAPGDRAPRRRRGRPVTIAAGRSRGCGTCAGPGRSARGHRRDPVAHAGARRALPRRAGRAHALRGLRAVVVDSGDDARAMHRVVDACRPRRDPRALSGRGDVQLSARDQPRAPGAPATATCCSSTTTSSHSAAIGSSAWSSCVDAARVGIVGALLRYPDGRIQHAGVTIGEGTRSPLPRRARATRAATASSCSCPATPRRSRGRACSCAAEVLDELGGHDEGFVQVYGDVDLCFRAGQCGWRVAWCAGAELEHSSRRATAARSTARTSAASLSGGAAIAAPRSGCGPDGDRRDPDTALGRPARRRASARARTTRSSSRAGPGRPTAPLDVTVTVGGRPVEVLPGRWRPDVSAALGHRRDPRLRREGTVTGLPPGPVEVVVDRER